MRCSHVGRPVFAAEQRIVSTAQEMRAGSASKWREHRWRLSAADPARVRRGTPCPGWGGPLAPCEEAAVAGPGPVPLGS